MWKKIRLYVYSGLAGAVLSGAILGFVFWSAYTDSKAASAVELGRLTESNRQLNEAQQRLLDNNNQARSILIGAGATIDKIKRLIILYWPDK